MKNLKKIQGKYLEEGDNFYFERKNDFVRTVLEVTPHHLIYSMSHTGPQHYARAIEGLSVYVEEQPLLADLPVGEIGRVGAHFFVGHTSTSVLNIKSGVKTWRSACTANYVPCRIVDVE